MSNLGKWAPWYNHYTSGHMPVPYGVSRSYKLGADWLKGCDSVEDWGCGLGYFRTQLASHQKYVGIDGTASPFADVVADLVEYLSETPGLFIRGVLEHERNWKSVLANAVNSFTRRMCLVLFTPMADVTREIHFVAELGVPDISFAMTDLLPFFAGVQYRYEDIQSDTGYGGERVIYLEKS